ncbi:MAG: hypothetical protein KDD61_09295 [Bdellovibrionales bacterium]|nr:hypothetical protein [Bdellovibrionales bacterium]
MTGFFKKLFGSKESGGEGKSPAAELVKDLLDDLIDVAGFELQYDVRFTEKKREISVELVGADEDALTDKEGQLIDAIQLFLKRAIQHHLPEERVSVVVDSNGYREEANRSLLELADKLKGIAVDKGKPVYFRALPPRERKVIHQYLAEDGRVKSRSIGDGLYKKIKIFPVKENSNSDRASNPSMS